jgi:tetratricopeptide (TPR) repeat protein
MAPARIHLLPDCRRDWLAVVGLAAVAFGVFAPSIGYGYVTFDDPYYVLGNAHVKSGLNADSIRWAFTTFDLSNWHPLTWLSLELDVSLWGMNSQGFHVTNVLLHAANTAILFLALRALTGAFWTSFTATLLFAVHPLRVESVAWVTERKDVLSAFFGLLALWLWAGYLAAPSAWRYLLVAMALALSLLAKPMLVTLPCLLLVLDWWPLGRASRMRDWPWLVLEKLPLLIPVVIAATLTYHAQLHHGSVKDLTAFPLDVRLENAAVSYVEYLSKTVWPFGLAVYYPHPGADGLPISKLIGASGLLAAITLTAVLLRRRAPYLLAGWLWYLGTLVPVIGLVQVGNQAMADRYTYIPQVGLLVAICQGAADLARAYSRGALAALAAAAVFLTVLTHDQLELWRDSVDLWQHSIRAAGESTTSLISLGRALEDKNSYPEALHNYEQALKIEPNSVQGLTCLGGLLSRMGRPDEALPHLTRAISLDPEDPLVHSYIGNVYYQRGQMDNAVIEETKAIELAPGFAAAYCTLGSAEAARGNLERAAERYQEAIRLEPRFAEAHFQLGQVMLSRGENEEALDHILLALQYNPRIPQASLILAKAYCAVGESFLSKGEPGRALPDLLAAVERDPELWNANLGLGKALMALGDSNRADGYFKQAARLNPRSAEALYYFGMALARNGVCDEAEKRVGEALTMEPGSAKFQLGMACILDALAAGLAAEGNHTVATATARRARDLAATAGDTDLVQKIEKQIHHYERGETGQPAQGNRR